MYGMANEGRLGGNYNDLPDSKEHKINKCGLQLVKFQGLVYIKKVECGSSFTIALTTEGLIFSWGFGKSGSLGLGESSSAKIPEQILTLYNGEKCQNMTDISCGSSHSLSVDNLGKIYSWGNG